VTAQETEEERRPRRKVPVEAHVAVALLTEHPRLNDVPAVAPAIKEAILWSA
jgi:hypothetical protein